MKIKEFFKNTKKTLGIKTPKDEELSKINRLEETLAKLITSKNNIKINLKNTSISLEERSELEEELQVYKLQIKKGQEILKRKKNK